MSRVNSGLCALCLTASCAPKETPSPGADSVAVTPVPPPPAAARTTPVGSWRWISIVTPVETIHAPATGQYTLVIADSTATGVADCNRMTGKVTYNETQLSFGPLATTKMGCPPGGLGDRYLKFLDGATGWFYRNDTLYIDLKMDSGTMRFTGRE